VRSASYLIPIDAALGAEDEPRYEAIETTGSIASRMRARGSA